MFVTEYVNEWDEVTYLPTTLSKVILSVLIVVLLAVAVIISMKRLKVKPSVKLTTKQLAFCAMAIAIGNHHVSEEIQCPVLCVFATGTCASFLVVRLAMFSCSVHKTLNLELILQA